MSYIQSDLRDADAETGVEIVDSADALETIARPDCAALIWRRQVDARFQSWIDALDPALLPSSRVIVRPERAGAVLEQLGDISGLPAGPERRWLEQDVAELAQRFATILRAPYVRLRLQTVTNNACVKFHVDAVTARLICTYRGSGTQYGIATEGSDPQRIHQVATGAPMIMRGRLWAEQPASGFLHRSPPILGTGETRFVLVLDPVFDLEESD